MFLIPQKILRNEFPSLTILHISSKKCRKHLFILSMMLLDTLQHAIGVSPILRQILELFRIVDSDKYLRFFTTSNFISS